MFIEKGGVKPPSPAQRGLRSGAPHSKAGSARKCPNSSFKYSEANVSAKAYVLELIPGRRFATFGAMADCSPEQVRQSLAVLLWHSQCVLSVFHTL
jgi:hypothetical protein